MEAEATVDERELHEEIVEGKKDKEKHLSWHGVGQKDSTHHFSWDSVVNKLPRDN